MLPTELELRRYVREVEEAPCKTFTQITKQPGKLEFSVTYFKRTYVPHPTVYRFQHQRDILLN